MGEIKPVKRVGKSVTDDETAWAVADQKGFIAFEREGWNRYECPH